MRFEHEPRRLRNATEKAVAAQDKVRAFKAHKRAGKAAWRAACKKQKLWNLGWVSEHIEHDYVQSDLITVIDYGSSIAGRDGFPTAIRRCIMIFTNLGDCVGCAARPKLRPFALVRGAGC